MKTIIILTAGLFLLWLLPACTKVQGYANVPPSSVTNPEVSVVLLSDPLGIPDFDDEDLAKCISSSMLEVNPVLRVVPASQFKESVYPYFMPSTTPRTLDNFKVVIGNEEVRRRVAALGVRYLIILIKKETFTDWHGGIFCGGGPGGGGCLGFQWWDRNSDFGVAIWDLKDLSLVGTIKSKAAGTGIMPAFILPIPLYVPRTETAVCQDLGNRLAELLSGRR